MAAQLGFTRIFFDCNLCCDAEELDICEFIAENCPGGGELDTNFLEDDLTQDAPRTHNFAGFSHTWNSVGALTWDNDGDIVFVNAFVQDDTQTDLLVRNSTTGRVEFRDVSSIVGADQNLFETVRVAGQSDVVADTTTDVLTLVAGTNITITTNAATDEVTINSTGGAGDPDQNLFETIRVAGQSDVVADNTTDILTLVAGTNITITTNAATDEVTINATGGAGDPDQNLFETVRVAGQSDVVADNTTDILTLVAGSNITITTNAATDEVTINSSATVSLCDADGDTCFVNEETADEDVIRFTIGITDVRTFAGFINDTSVAYGREAGLLIPTDKTLEQTLIGKCAGKDLTATSTQNTMLGSDAGLLHTVLTRSIFIGEHAGQLALGADEGTGHSLIVAIGEYAGADQSENASANIWIGTNAGRGAGDFAPSGEGPLGCIGIGQDVLRNIHGSPNRAIGMGLNTLNMMQIGAESIFLGDEAAESYVGTLTPGEELDQCAGVGFKVAGDTTLRLWQSSFLGHGAGQTVDTHVNNVIVGWTASTSPTATKIPSLTTSVVVGSAAANGMGGSQNTVLGDAAAARGNTLGTNNTTISRTVFLGSGSWYDKIDLDRGVAIGPGVKVANDDTMILGFIQDIGDVLPDEQLKIGIGTDNPLTDIQINSVNNGLRYQTGAEGLNKVLGATDGLGTIDYFSAEVLTEATVTTTDATVTTCGLIATTTDRAYHVESRISARQTTDSSQVASYKRIATFRNDGGTLALVGTVTDDHTSEDVAGWDATIDASGTDIRVRVTGAAATNIDWKTRTSIVEV